MLASIAAFIGLLILLISLLLPLAASIQVAMLGIGFILIGIFLQLRIATK